MNEQEKALIVNITQRLENCEQGISDLLKCLESHFENHIRKEKP